MNEIIYLEPDNDIASVIGRIKEVESDLISLVIPRGGTIAQSIVNLKLLKREAEKLKKDITLVSSDKISKNLASQVGITVFNNVNEAKSVKVKLSPAPETFEERPVAAISEIMPGGIKINRYNKDEDSVEEIVATEEEEGIGDGEGTDDQEILKPTESPDGRQVQDDTRENKGENPEPVREKITEKHIVHEVVKEVPREVKPQENHKIEADTKSINPISPNEVEEYEKMQPSTYSQRRNLSSRRKPLLIILGVFVVALLVLAFIFLPSAEADVTLKADDIKASVEVTIDTNAKTIDQDNSVLPGETISSDKEITKEITATGKKDVGTKAVGTVTFYNYFDSNNAVSIPAGTVVTASGLNFTLDAAISVPKATATVISLSPLNIKTDPGTVEAKITASSPGDNYNLAPSKFVVSAFSGDKKEKVYAQSSAKLTGGTTKQVTVVSDDDISKAKTALTTDLSSQLSDVLNKQAVDANKKLIASTIKEEVIAYDTTVKSGDEAETFKATLKLKDSATAFAETGLKEFVTAKITKDIGAGQMIVNPDKLNIEYDVVSTDAAKGTTKILVKYAGKTSKLVDQADVVLKVAGKKLGDAKNAIESIDGVQKAEIKISPSFYPSTPFLKSRVKVVFGYEE